MPANNTYEPHAGRVALVTGTSRGIGQAIAVGLAQRGARVVLAAPDLMSLWRRPAGKPGPAMRASTENFPGSSRWTVHRR